MARGSRLLLDSRTPGPAVHRGRALGCERALTHGLTRPGRPVYCRALLFRCCIAANAEIFQQVSVVQRYILTGHSAGGDGGSTFGRYPMAKKLFAAARSPRLARRWEERRNAAAVAAVLGAALVTLLASSAVQRPAVAGPPEPTPAPVSAPDESS